MQNTGIVLSALITNQAFGNHNAHNYKSVEFEERTNQLDASLGFTQAQSMDNSANRVDGIINLQNYNSGVANSGTNSIIDAYKPHTTTKATTKMYYDNKTKTQYLSKNAQPIEPLRKERNRQIDNTSHHSSKARHSKHGIDQKTNTITMDKEMPNYAPMERRMHKATPQMGYDIETEVLAKNVKPIEQFRKEINLPIDNALHHSLKAGYLQDVIDQNTNTITMDRQNKNIKKMPNYAAMERRMHDARENFIKKHQAYLVKMALQNPELSNLLQDGSSISVEEIQTDATRAGDSLSSLADNVESEVLEMNEHAYKLYNDYVAEHPEYAEYFKQLQGDGNIFLTDFGKTRKDLSNSALGLNLVLDDFINEDDSFVDDMKDVEVNLHDVFSKTDKGSMVSLNNLSHKDDLLETMKKDFLSKTDTKSMALLNDFISENDLLENIEKDTVDQMRDAMKNAEYNLQDLSSKSDTALMALSQMNKIETLDQDNSETLDQDIDFDYEIPADYTNTHSMKNELSEKAREIKDITGGTKTNLSQQDPEEEFEDTSSNTLEESMASSQTLDENEITSMSDAADETTGSDTNSIQNTSQLPDVTEIDDDSNYDTRADDANTNSMQNELSENIETVDEQENEMEDITNDTLEESIQTLDENENASIFDADDDTDADDNAADYADDDADDDDAIAEVSSGMKVEVIRYILSASLVVTLLYMIA